MNAQPAPNIFDPYGQPNIYGMPTEGTTDMSDVADTVRMAMGQGRQPFSLSDRAQMMQQQQVMQAVARRFSGNDNRLESAVRGAGDIMGDHSMSSTLANNPEVRKLAQTLFYNSPLATMTGGDPRGILYGGVEMAASTLNNTRAGAMSPTEALAGEGLANMVMDQFTDYNGVLNTKKSAGLSMDELGSIMSNAGRKGLLAGEDIVDTSEAAMEEFMQTGKRGINADTATKMNAFMEDSAKMFGSLKKVFTGKGINELMMISEQITGLVNKPKESKKRIDSMMAAAINTGEDIRGALGRAFEMSQSAQNMGFNTRAAGTYASTASPLVGYQDAANKAAANNMLAVGIDVPLLTSDELKIRQENQLGYAFNEDPSQVASMTAALAVARGTIVNEDLNKQIDSAIASGDKQEILAAYNAVNSSIDGMNMESISSQLTGTQLTNTLGDPTPVFNSVEMGVANTDNRKMVKGYFKNVLPEDNMLKKLDEKVASGEISAEDAEKYRPILGDSSERLGNAVQDMQKGNLVTMMSHLDKAAAATTDEDKKAAVDKAREVLKGDVTTLGMTDEEREEKLNSYSELSKAIYETTGKGVGKVAGTVTGLLEVSPGYGGRTAGDSKAAALRQKRITTSGLVSGTPWVEESSMANIVTGALGMNPEEVISNVTQQLVDEGELTATTIDKANFDKLQSQDVTALMEQYGSGVSEETIIENENFGAVVDRFAGIQKDLEANIKVTDKDGNQTETTLMDVLGIRTDADKRSTEKLAEDAKSTNPDIKKKAELEQLRRMERAERKLGGSPESKAELEAILDKNGLGLQQDGEGNIQVVSATDGTSPEDMVRDRTIKLNNNYYRNIKDRQSMERKMLREGMDVKGGLLSEVERKFLDKEDGLSDEKREKLLKGAQKHSAISGGNVDNINAILSDGKNRKRFKEWVDKEGSDALNVFDDSILLDKEKLEADGRTGAASQADLNKVQDSRDQLNKIGNRTSGYDSWGNPKGKGSPEGKGSPGGNNNNDFVGTLRLINSGDIMITMKPDRTAGG